VKGHVLFYRYIADEAGAARVFRGLNPDLELRRGGEPYGVINALFKGIVIVTHEILAPAQQGEQCREKQAGPYNYPFSSDQFLLPLQTKHQQEEQNDKGLFQNRLQLQK
jgi:hypothetical protein